MSFGEQVGLQRPEAQSSERTCDIVRSRHQEKSEMTAELDVRDDQAAGSTMSVDEAMALSACPWRGTCDPPCRHCTASAQEREAARRWLADHPGRVEAWRAERLGDIASTLRIWEAFEDPSSASRWGVRSADGCESEILVADLTRERAIAVAEAHNAERERALAIVDWFAGA